MSAPDKSRLTQLVMEAMGTASMCWHPYPTGVFDSDEVQRLGNRLVEQLLSAGVDPGSTINLLEHPLWGFAASEVVQATGDGMIEVTTTYIPFRKQSGQLVLDL